MTDGSSGSCYPTVIIPGIGQSKTVEVDDSGNRLGTAWPLKLDKEALKKRLMPSAAKMMLLRHDAGFGDKLYDAICGELDRLKCNEDGSPKRNIRVVSYPYPISKFKDEQKRFVKMTLPYRKLTDAVGEDKVYYFSYNSFGRTLESAETLHSFIQTVKKQTGGDKVNLVAMGLGATVAAAYLDKYVENGDVKRLIGVMSAFNGSSVICGLLTKNIDRNDYSGLFEKLLGKRSAEKLLTLFSKIPEKLVDKYVDVLVDAFCDTVLKNSPMMWGTVPADKYEMTRDRYISGVRYNKLREQTDKAFKIRSDLPAFVKRMNDCGVEIFSLCGYGLPIFAVNSKDITSDRLVDTASASMGARCAPLGRAITDADENSGFLSPDKTIDASKSPIAETTWFFKDLDHEDPASCEKLFDLVGRLIKDDSIKDVFSDPDYPQFNETKGE
ncbi:MAG: hypothetical protein K6F09_08215 [Clostridiales bacterium]|nr:hypothetical protein [Clostridiales bacterium]